MTQVDVDAQDKNRATRGIATPTQTVSRLGNIRIVARSTNSP